nr:hypothetical protein [Tanacetum cinerariifolium]
MNQNFYNSNSSGFDQSQPSQFPVIHQPPQEMSIQEMEDLKKQYLDEMKQLVDNLSTYPSKRFNSFFYDDDDDEDYAIAVTPSLSIEEPDNSLIIGNEHLDTILATESDEFQKYSVENLVPITSESEGESECDVPVCKAFKTFSNILFDAENDFYSSDDQSFYNTPCFWVIDIVNKFAMYLLYFTRLL